ncbi:MAG: DUF1501 domain-containing protein [Alphaproteobacteria bacterium]|nr:DUF1501 domain-containing protein [Alphaproteobacteria bacterium]MCB9793377.1 DUF1501 domain-containing protein [Alphaproteobacteria bacterium]
MTHRLASPLLSRRALLGGASGLAAFTAAAPYVDLSKVAWAQELAQDRYFIFCYFSGGWDLLLSLDPRDPEVFSPDLRKVTRIETGFQYLASDRRSLVETAVPEMRFGPYIGRLAEHAERLCLVRGVSMDTLTHEVGRRRFITGKPPAGLQAQGSSFATVLAALLGQNEPIPQLSVRVESYNDAWAADASAIKVNSVDDLIRALRAAPDSLPAGEQEAIDQLLGAWQGCAEEDADAWRQLSFGYRDAAKELVSLGLDSRFDFAANTSEMEALRDLYGIDPGDMRAAPAQAAAAVTAITSGIARCVSIVVAEDLDAHGPEWAEGHGPRLEAGFDTCAALIEDLASREYQDSGESWLEHVTLIGFSEFGRTAMLNSSGGRDHSLLNACFLAGAGVPQGRVLGRSSDVGMAPMEIDLATGAPETGGETLYPENLFRALLEGIGVSEDVADYRAEALSALLS